MQNGRLIGCKMEDCIIVFNDMIQAMDFVNIDILCKHAKNKVNCILMSIQMNSICLKSIEPSNSSCPLLSNLNMIRLSIYVPWMHLSLENERVRWSNRIVASILLHCMRVSWYRKDFGLRIFSLSYWNLQV